MSSIVKKILTDLRANDLLSLQPSDLSDADALLMWSVFDVLEKKAIKERKSIFRDHLLSLAKSKGIVNKKGSYEYNPPSSDGKITASVRKGKVEIDENGLESLLKEKDVSYDVFERKVSIPEDLFYAIGHMIHREEINLGALERLFNILDSVNPVANHEKLERLLEDGKISSSELASVTKIKQSMQLRVKQPSIIKEMQ